MFALFCLLMSSSCHIHELYKCKSTALFWKIKKPHFIHSIINKNVIRIDKNTLFEDLGVLSLPILKQYAEIQTVTSFTVKDIRYQS